MSHSGRRRVQIGLELDVDVARAFGLVGSLGPRAIQPLAAVPRQRHPAGAGQSRAGPPEPHRVQMGLAAQKLRPRAARRAGSREIAMRSAPRNTVASVQITSFCICRRPPWSVFSIWQRAAGMPSNAYIIVAKSAKT